MLFASINLKDMEGSVSDYIIKNILDGDKKRFEEEMWGYEEYLSEKMFNEEMFSDVEEDGIQTNISRSNKNFQQLYEFSCGADVFFDSSGKRISEQEYEEQVQTDLNCVISVCEVSPTE
jgi:hypothetical protein